MRDEADAPAGTDADAEMALLARRGTGPQAGAPGSGERSPVAAA